MSAGDAVMLLSDCLEFGQAIKCHVKEEMTDVLNRIKQQIEMFTVLFAAETFQYMQVP